jgi:peroxiredoxin
MPVAWAIVIIALWVVVIGLVVVVLGVIRQLTPVLERLAAGQAHAPRAPQGPPVGEPLPEFTGRGSDGEAVTAADLRGSPSLLVFLHSSCQPCTTLADELSTADLTGLAAELTVVTDPGSKGNLMLPVAKRVVLQSDEEVSDALGVRAVPFAIAVDGRGIVRAKRAVNTVGQVTKLAAIASPVPVVIADSANAH